MATHVRDPFSEKRATKSLQRFVEFKGIRRWGLQQYQDRVKQIYDGPAGWMLPLGSVISLHEPLVGRLFRAKKFDVSGCKDILDVGSGAGQILGHLVRASCPAARLVACDLSAQMLRRARQRLKTQRPSFVASDVAHLPFADASFDCITCGWVLEHLPDPRPGLLEFARVLRPGGRVLILATEDTLSGAVVSRTWKCRTYSREELKSACEEAGLPWCGQIWFTPLHRLLKMGGILVEAVKSNGHPDLPR